MGFQTTAAAKKNWQLRRRKLFRKVLRPRPRIGYDDWADRYRYLSEVNTSEAGRFRTARVPWIRGILRVIADPDVRRIAVVKPSQVAWTEGVIGNFIGYHVHLRPRSMVVMQPSKEDAEDWSKDKLTQLIEATPVLRGLIADMKSRSSSNTISTKSFTGGTLKIVGGTSPKSLRRTSAPFLVVDERDGLPPSAGKEGDPLLIFLKRGQTFPDRKELIGSTPVHEKGGIVELVNECDVVFDYYWPCPDCGHRQIPEWGGPDKLFGIKYEAGPDPANPGRKKVVKGSVFYECAECHAVIEETDRDSMVAAADWFVTTRGTSENGQEISVPGRSLDDFLADPEKGESVGFRIPASIISPFDGCRWEVLVQEWLDAQGNPLKLQVFFNTRLAKPWDPKDTTFDPAKLETRVERYGAEVPHGVGLLTMGVDVQVDRLEAIVEGWGHGLESWLVGHWRIYGDPEQPEVWQQLEALRVRPWRHVSGATLRAARTFVDSGYLTKSVYAYVRGKEDAVFAIKGQGGKHIDLLRRAAKPNRFGVKPWTIAVDKFKDSLFRRLAAREPGPGYMHFCKHPEMDTAGGLTPGADAEYFAQFGRERWVQRKARDGGMGRGSYVEYGAHEAVDLHVYSHAALLSIPGITEQLGALAKALSEQKAPVLATAAPARGRRVISRGIR